MSHFIVKTEYGQWLYPRRGRGRARTAFGSDVKQARVFNTKSAASNAARQAYKGDFLIIPVTLDFNNEAGAEWVTR